MKRFGAALILAVVCMCVALRAQDQQGSPSSRDDVIKLFDVMQIRQQMELVMQQMFQQMRAMSREEMKDRKAQAGSEDMAKADALADKIMKEFSVSDMLDDMIPVYQKHLSKSDVDEMIKFYSTPTGQKILRELPAMTGEGIQAMQPRLHKLMDQITSEIDQMVKNDQARPAAKPHPKPAPKKN